MQIVHDKDVFFIHEKKYLEKVLQKFNMSDCKSMSTPADSKLSLTPSPDGGDKTNLPYRALIGSLMFLATVSRPDIAFIVSYLSRFLNSYSDVHYSAAKRVLRSLSGTKDFGILYKKSPRSFDLKGFSDSDFANDCVNRRSVTGYIFFRSQGPITWSSFRQSTVATSTTEAEYMAASAASREAVWLARLMRDVGRQGEIKPRIFVDNQSALKLSKNPDFHKRTKHIDVHHHFIRQKYESGEIDICYVKSQNQQADILTKSLVKEKFIPFRSKICYCFQTEKL